ncbi:hypothetical protein [Streptomyces litmocidini]|uniref:hypothetical protein n=1 Tax=Streptomyces litmocidini TaxID=67318 RepID=UPI0036F72340
MDARFPGIVEPTFHAADDSASCRAAERCGFGLEAVLPARPPLFPVEGRPHVRGGSVRP